MGFTRRDLLKFTGGSAAGLALTPVPWGLLRDTAVMSENWPGVPHPPHGEIHARYTTCTLCPAGCGVRARCVGDQPVSLAGVAGHPASRGALCPTGLLGHHFTFCRGRATEPLINGRPSSIAEVLAAVSAAIAGCDPRESVAILDPRPGRAASLVYRRYLGGLPKGLHCALPNAEPYGAYGIDLENTRAILSFGAPVLDGWLSPGRVLANRSHFQLIQAEPAYSRTASLADVWVPLLPGSEATFASAVARALEGGDAGDAQAANAARILRHNQPAIVLGGGAAGAHLNAILANAGRPGGFFARRDFTPAADIAALPDHSIRVLLVEESTGAEPLPWDLLRTKLAPQPVVVALTPWLDGVARHAGYVVPSPVYLESLDEVPTPAGATVAGFSLSPALLAAPPKAIPPVEFILKLAGDSATYPDILKQRVAAIRKDRRGSVFTYAGAKSARISEFTSDADLWKALLAGAAWQDDSGPGPMPAAASKAAPSFARSTPTPDYPLILIAADSPPPHGSPLLSKLYRESGLRRPANAATVHPKTGQDQGLTDGGRALLKTPAAASTVQVIFDASVMPGVIEMTGPETTVASIRRA